MRRNNLIVKITFVALIIAIMIIFGFTPIGTLQIGPLTYTLMGIPVGLAAALLGPSYGALFGFVWGSISLIQGVSGIDASGPILMEYSLFGLVFTCYIPRILTGFLVGYISKLISKVDKKRVIYPFVASALVTIFNTLFFMSSYVGFFFNAPAVQESVHALADQFNFNPNNPIMFIIFAVGLNFIIEFAANLIICSACIIALDRSPLLTKMGYRKIKDKSNAPKKDLDSKVFEDRQDLKNNLEDTQSN